MLVEKLSASALTTFDRCPHKFILSYQLGLKSATGVAAGMGTCTHKVFELLAQGKLGRTVNDEIVGLVTPASMTEDEIIELVITKYPEKYPEVGLAEKNFKEIREVAKRGLAYNDGEFNPRNYDNIIEPEKRFSIEIDEPYGHFYLNGFIDLVVQTGEDSILLVDYKTAGKLKDFDSDKDINLEYTYKSIQARLYHYAATKLYPQFKFIDVVFYYLKHDTSFPVYIDVADSYKVDAFLKRKYQEMLAIKTTKLVKSWKCRFCDHFKPLSGEKGTESICEFYRKQIVVNGLESTKAKYKVEKPQKVEELPQ